MKCQSTLYMSSSLIWPIDRTIRSYHSGAIVNEGVIHILKSSSIIEASPSDCFVSYPGHTLWEVLPLCSCSVGEFYSPSLTRDKLRKFKISTCRQGVIRNALLYAPVWKPELTKSYRNHQRLSSWSWWLVESCHLRSRELGFRDLKNSIKEAGFFDFFFFLLFFCGSGHEEDNLYRWLREKELYKETRIDDYSKSHWVCNPFLQISTASVTERTKGKN